MSCGGCCGGWKKQSNLEDETVKAVADFALNHLKKRSNSAYPLKLASIKCCETQVVAGTNFKLVLEVGGSPKGTTFDKTVVVYKKLDGTMEVTKIE